MSQSKDEVLPEPPPLQEHHVRLPEQVAKILRASSAHAKGYTGKEIRVAVIDSGFFPHPFYISRGYKIRYIPTRGEPRPHVDEYGHGTAQLANLFAIAPQCEALAIKCRDRDPSDAIEKAISLRPDILNCAWGFNIDHSDAEILPAEYVPVHELLLKAIRLGITVVAAAGNGQHSFPGNMPEVISAGGVFYGPDGKLRVSDVSSSYTSRIFRGREVPDICGLVGNRPHGRLILVPVPPRARLARASSFAAIAAGDSMPSGRRGWAMFSGTSASTAMVSGAAALVLQANPRLNPGDVKNVLMKTAAKVGRTRAKVLAVDRAIPFALSYQR